VCELSRFDGKTILVTGGASGIGAATVRLPHAEGATVAVADLRQEDLDKLASGLSSSDRFLAIPTNVANRDEVAAFVAGSVERFGTPHGLVNCAGIRCVGSVLDLEPEDWQRALDVNLTGTFTVCQAFARVVTKAGTPGSIVNMSSAAGIRGIPNRIGYTASKFGVSGILCRSLLIRPQSRLSGLRSNAYVLLGVRLLLVGLVMLTMSLELAPHGIRVNAIAPGMIRTPFTAAMFADPENAKAIVAAHPVGRVGEPEEIANTIAFLLSEDSSFITGVVMPADGGQTVGIGSF
jgi:NAD(P)-dependent dehydrogenase (short-subunit alcohol dehydrogenase family)